MQFIHPQERDSYAMCALVLDACLVGQSMDDDEHSMKIQIFACRTVVYVALWMGMGLFGISHSTQKEHIGQSLLLLLWTEQAVHAKSWNL